MADDVQLSVVQTRIRKRIRIVLAIVAWTLAAIGAAALVLASAVWLVEVGAFWWTGRPAKAPGFREQVAGFGLPVSFLTGLTMLAHACILHLALFAEDHLFALRRRAQ